MLVVQKKFDGFFLWCLWTVNFLNTMSLLIANARICYLFFYYCSSPTFCQFGVPFFCELLHTAFKLEQRLFWHFCPLSYDLKDSKQISKVEEFQPMCILSTFRNYRVMPCMNLWKKIVDLSMCWFSSILLEYHWSIPQDLFLFFCSVKNPKILPKHKKTKLYTWKTECKKHKKLSSFCKIFYGHSGLLFNRKKVSWTRIFFYALENLFPNKDLFMNLKKTCSWTRIVFYGMEKPVHKQGFLFIKQSKNLFRTRTSIYGWK